MHKDTKPEVFLISILLFVFINSASAQNPTVNRKWESFISLKNYLNPFWTSDTIYDETIQPIKGESGEPIAALLFKAKKIISVKDAYLKEEFKRGIDWTYKNGKIILPSKSHAPFFNKSELVFNEEKKGWSLGGKEPGTYVLYNDEGFLRSKQLTVTYIPEKKEKWNGPRPVFAESYLSNTISKLRNKDSVKIVFYGNSIEFGDNASGILDEPPFMPIWPDLIILNLQLNYHANISSANLSKGGARALWGMENVSKLIIPQKPDLTIIGFGMNDGTSKVKPELYRNYIGAIIDSIRHDNPLAEFILIAPMLANPFSKQNQIQEQYGPELIKLTGKGIIVADITNVHKELLKYKSYQDMTGNNINHPNDYLARWYAQYISNLLIHQ